MRDGAGRVYFKAAAAPEVTFTAGGALGSQTIDAIDPQGRVSASVSFPLQAASGVEDHGGRFASLFQIALKTMRGEHAGGVGEIAWRGKTYHYFEPWILDHSHTTKGMQYFSPIAGEMVDLNAAAQKASGMIWSFAFPDDGPAHGYHYWAYKDQGYAMVDGGVEFARQPVENHNEANFVDALYLAWKASGDDAWMASHLDAARKALDYSVTDPARWSSRFLLLKRGYTIDSWDFQPADQYLVPFPLGDRQQIDPKRTKFTIFFGDNTAYAHACDQLVEMLEHAGRASDAGDYKQRAGQIRERLGALAWNGRFFTHHIEEDPTVTRKFGVDEKSQLAMSNAYSLNRGIREDQAAAIIEAYQDLRHHLPNRSPGEWYAVYPPYERGFGGDGERWQYMNGGVQPHAAGELARGALEHGFEGYGADILLRLRDLGAAHDGKLYFAYTGAWDPPPPEPAYTTIDLAPFANMDLASQGAPGVPAWLGHAASDDMRNLPIGTERFAGIPFAITDPGKNGRKAAVGVALQTAGFAPRVEIPIHQKAAALYLLHAVEGAGTSNVAAAVRFEYEDGASRSVYLFRDKHIAGANWVKLSNPDAGVAWSGANGYHCLSWAAIANPEPGKAIGKLVFVASEEGARYGLAGLTLGSRMPYHEAGPISFGGPDNWSAALVMYALMEGMAGVRDLDTAYRSVEVSPRWTAAGVDEVAITARYAASSGYVTYRLKHDASRRSISVLATGAAEKCRLRILLPKEASGVKKAQVDGVDQPVQLEHVRNSLYATVTVSLLKPTAVDINTEPNEPARRPGPYYNWTLSFTRRTLLSQCAGIAAWAEIAAAQTHAHEAVKSGAPPQFQTLDAATAGEIEALTSQIIPSGESPGAREAGVVYFIDRALRHIRRRQERCLPHRHGCHTGEAPRDVPGFPQCGNS